MKIQNKLFVASLLAVLMLVAAMLLLMRWSIDRGMLSYVNSKRTQSMENVAAALAAHYSEKGSWQFLQGRPREFHNIIRSNAGEFAQELGPGRGAARAKLLQRFDQARHKKRLHDLGERLEHRLEHGVKRGVIDDDTRDLIKDRWDEAKRQPRRPPDGPALEHRRPPPPGAPALDLFALENASAVLVVGQKSEGVDYHSVPIELDDKPVGYFYYQARDEITEGFELSFIQQQNQTFAAIATLMLLFAALFSLPIARHLVNPVETLAKQIRALAQGNYKQSTAIKRGDEIGDLSNDLNLLSRTLEENETMRQRWVADTSHELRTPIALLQAQLEAMQDGVRPLNRDSLDSIHEEILRLSRLIDDLQQLSVSDLGSLRYNMQAVDISTLVERCAERHQSAFDNAGLQFKTEIAPAVTVMGDSTRLQQLFDNVLANSLKYTASPGQVRATLRCLKGKAILTVADSAPGVSDEQLAHLFDYLYRAEQSRNRQTGGSGLGLSIAKRIVEAHAGEISVSHAAKGGIEVNIILPLCVS